MLHTDIKTPADAFAYLGLDFAKLPDFSSVPEEDRKYMLNHYVTIKVVQALNRTVDGKNWKPNWFTGEYKYRPWVWVNADKKRPSGFGFSDTSTHCVGTLTAVCSRLYFRTRELSDYAIKQFEELYLEEFLYRD